MAATTKHKVLLNVDMGEAYGNWSCGPDLEILPMIDIANIACGFHGGDPLIMAETVQACKKHNVKCGAHPGLPDLQGFGRREMKLSPEELTAITVYQVGSLKGFLDREGIPLHHVKPHGALYGMMCRDYDVAKAVMLGIPKGVPVLGLAGTNMEKAASDVGVPFWAEFYGDVKYTDTGHLILDRKKKPWKIEGVQAHVRQQLEHHSVTSVGGLTVELPVKGYPVSVCCHSDSPGCLDIINATKDVIAEYNQTLN
ncbi:Lactam utilization protein lamB [Pestalotiopsis fici W106-1]|uniref:Lactam utilization protein lamB n=1 Tax=Pestalotiopsis fici (strain W106-1 / CGMCC3.15140) TaxID=1229662 RepID=W3XKW0_PESFW|nr:Lactam utilization protein lamB [Pestalotiopsis fici W106-1]ETS86630.1 Lactam utilization protein lamB [Pestalotiopsis fici W106-1]